MSSAAARLYQDDDDDDDGDHHGSNDYKNISRTTSGVSSNGGNGGAAVDTSRLYHDRDDDDFTRATGHSTIGTTSGHGGGGTTRTNGGGGLDHSSVGDETTVGHGMYDDTENSGNDDLNRANTANDPLDKMLQASKTTFYFWFRFVCCLNPKLTLRTQLLTSFGTVTTLIIGSVMIGCIGASLFAADSIKKINEEAFEIRINELQSTTISYLAESLEQQFIPTSLVDILVETTKDIFHGYEYSDGNSDSPPPPILFKDIYTGENIYPILGVNVNNSGSGSSSSGSIVEDDEIEINIDDDDGSNIGNDNSGAVSDNPINNNDAVDGNITNTNSSNATTNSTTSLASNTTTRRRRKRRRLQLIEDGGGGSGGIPFSLFTSASQIKERNALLGGGEDDDVSILVTEDNAKQHVNKQRWETYYKYYQDNGISTSNALYTTGSGSGGDDDGSTTTTPLLYNNTMAIVPLLKAMFEATTVIQDISIHYMNDGIGTTALFPAYDKQTLSNADNNGCDWITKMNPFDSTRSIGTEEQFDMCKSGRQVTDNDNPMDLAWCEQQAIDPFTVHTNVEHGKIVMVEADNGTTTTDSIVDDDNWLITMGKSVYDRHTNNFIACTKISISLSLVKQRLQQSLTTENSHMTLIRFDEQGTVIATTFNDMDDVDGGDDDSSDDIDIATATTSIDQLNIGFTSSTYQSLYNLIDYDNINSNDSDDDIKYSTEIRQLYDEFVLTHDGYLVAISPIPRVPDDITGYKPKFFLVMSTSTSYVYFGVEQLNEEVQEHELTILYFAVIFGGIGWLVTCLVICCMSNALTIPLIYINVAAKDIVDSFGHGDHEAANKKSRKNRRQSTGVAYEDEIAGKDEEEEHEARIRLRDEMQRMWCTPKTELTDALEEFNLMVDNFSKDKLAKNEKVRQVEVHNKCKGLRLAFQELYNQRQDPSFPYKLHGLNLNRKTAHANTSGGGEHNNDYNDEYQPGQEVSEMFRHAGSNINRVQNVGVEKAKEKDTGLKQLKFITDTVGVVTDKVADGVGVVAGKVGEGVGVVANKVGETGNFIKGKLVGGQQQSTANLALQKQQQEPEKEQEEWYQSRLFLWIVGLIVTPLLLTAIAISAAVMYVVVIEFESSVADAKDYFVDIELDALLVHARLRSEVIGNLVAISTRDLYFLTRYFGWLLFGGIVRADTFTELSSGLEQCKDHVENDTLTTCPYYQDANKCDCEWNDKRVEECTTDFPNGSRQFHKVFFAVESSNALPDGDRNVSSYPEVATSAGTTEWWSDLKTVPGWEKGSSAAGHDTLYDRLRVSSAMPLFPVLYNYDVEKENYLAQFVGFEADGLFIRTAGCDVGSAIGSSGWKSSEGNGAAQLQPDLCPVGKHGYDPRCRGWYDTGKKKALGGKEFLHITAPYAFATSDLIGQSCTMALVDPSTGEHVGQVLSDFQSNSIFDALSIENTPLSRGGFATLITVEGEKDTVAGPGFSIGDEAVAVSELVLPMDWDCDDEGNCQGNDNWDGFQTIRNSMKAGQSSLSAFTRTRPQTGQGEEVVYAAQAPAKVSSIRPVDSSNFASGVTYNDFLVYSLGLFLTRDGLLVPFQQIEDDLERRLNWAIALLTLWIFGATIFVVYVSYLVASSITTPMLYLLGLIRAINGSDGMDGEPPKIDQSMGSLEINNVSDTVLVLYKIVRAANDFFFAGELELAYSVLIDSVKLFKKLNNRKAVGVSSNNLGCTLLAMYKEMDGLGWRKHSGLTKSEIIHRGKRLFQTSVKLGERNYNDVKRREGRITPKCVDAMQTVANRYFNRALFLLTVKDDHSNPEKYCELGVECLKIVKEMDKEFTKLIDITISGHKIFHRNLARVRGHNMLLEMGYADDEMMREKDWPGDWEIGDLLDESFKILQYEAQKTSSELFTHVSVLGRLQELETELMKYRLLVGDVETAAMIAIRMIREDAYVFADSMSMALEVLVVYASNIDKSALESEEFTFDGGDGVSTSSGQPATSAVNTLLYHDVRRFEKDLKSLTKATRATALHSISDQVSTKLSIGPAASSKDPHDTPYWSSSKAAPMASWTKNHVSRVVTMEDF